MLSDPVSETKLNKESFVLSTSENLDHWDEPKSISKVRKSFCYQSK